VLAEPIGILGWVNDGLRIHDEVGLVTPWIAQRRREGRAGWYADAVARYQPTWLVVRGNFLRDSRQFAGHAAPFRDSAELARTMEGYRLALVTNDPPGPQDLAVLRRR
jgi:hypothetical protein